MAAIHVGRDYTPNPTLNLPRIPLDILRENMSCQSPYA